MLHLEPTDLTLLQEILSTEHRRLLIEISRTDSREYKQMLHRRLERLDGMLGQMTQPV